MSAEVIARARFRVRRRQAAVVGGLVAVLVVLTAVALTLGRGHVSLPDVLSTVVGQGSRATDYIVLELKLPRALAAILVGLAFGVSGAVFQSLLGNPLASPDVIGISTGASAAAVFGLAVLGVGGPALSALALAGALLTAVVMYLLTWRGGVTGSRLVLVGVGLAAILLSVVSYLLTRTRVATAQDALVWLTGSLNGRNWTQVVPLAVLLAVLLPAVAALARALGLLTLGDDAAKGLGVAVEPVRLGLLACAVLLAGAATAAAGPVAFVALLAAPIGRRLVRDGGPALVASGLVGAAVVLGADCAAQNLPVDQSYPVGVLTGAVGAPYLLLLLARANRTGKGG
ncbi:iron chelate uptake ABC transporter family permease subunit [Actinosynnema sp. NPDC047251]|uniref:ABC-type siderophore transporter, permease subunit n=1 Tax=Saccharothrix espanaensis (strain ATCC 51144 / DSM 44229 / JCM 9112 / NBRC 15066 / NRRL 15764) TaxID=1179773 RepID=K0JZD6_SACES|nr:iron chelate uptake ABC transporter family permease subunit [Saccharothrix espanaensis]CCH29608.1 ABC-type siderophore transporter, permease subunit [Saccharothrix espanaensis DSM 44229]